MLIVPRVCAEFHDPEGNVLFAVTPHMLGAIVEAPESIRQDLLFRMLVSDGSLKAVESASEKQILENDPMAGVNAEGKSEADAAVAKAASGKSGRSAKAEKSEAPAPAAAPDPKAIDAK